MLTTLKLSESELLFVLLCVGYFTLRLVAFVYRTTRGKSVALGKAFEAGLMINLYVTVAHLTIGLIDCFSARHVPLAQSEVSLYGPVLLVLDYST